jgi:hypothetical protein
VYRDTQIGTLAVANAYIFLSFFSSLPKKRKRILHRSFLTARARPANKVFPPYVSNNASPQIYSATSKVELATY